MTKKTLKELIENEFERCLTISHFKAEVFRLIDVYNQDNNYQDELLTPFYLKELHPTLSDKEIVSLLEFSKSKTITFKSCYGDGSIIYPMWEKGNKL